MKGIYNKEFLEFIKEKNKYHDQKDSNSYALDWNVIEETFNLIKNIREESYAKSESYLGLEISIANLVVACHTHITFALFYVDSEKENLYSSSPDDNLGSVAKNSF